MAEAEGHRFAALLQRPDLQFRSHPRLLEQRPFGGDVGEPAQAIAKINAGDPESWYAAWNEEGDRTMAFAAKTRDPIAKGDAMIRAFNYYRSAEFFLSPADPRRPVV